MKKLILLLFVFFICFCAFVNFPIFASAETLSENIKDQMNNLDFSSVEEFLNNLSIDNDFNFISTIYSLLNGEYNTNANSILESVFSLLFGNVKSLLPSAFLIVGISVFCVLIQNVKSSFASDGVAEIISFVGLLTVILILSNQMFNLWNDSKKTLENISKLNEIMSPIILTLMVVSGGNVSASIFKPSVALFSNLVTNIITLIVLPLVGLIIVFNILSVFSKNIKLTKFVDFINSVVKWVIGICVTCFSLFVSVNGITSAIHDGISIKAIKYTISNSIPLVGGFLKDGFDLIIAGSILIKNAVGVASIGVLCYMILNPVIKVAIFGLILNLVSAITETISDSRISQLCTSISKSFSLINSVILLVSFMFFISILLMICSASAFV